MPLGIKWETKKSLLRKYSQRVGMTTKDLITREHTGTSLNNTSQCVV